jgi:hypothetical protein
VTTFFRRIFTRRVSVRASLSKAKHRYFSFLCDEGCGYLREQTPGTAQGHDLPARRAATCRVGYL